MMPSRVAQVLRRGPSSADAPFRIGTVTSTSPFLVLVGSAETAQPCSHLTSYTPVLDDVVVVLVSGGNRVVLGSIVAP